MARWFGKVGFVKTVETKPGVYVEQVTERSYYGDEIRNSRNLQETNNLNDDITVSIDISIVADPYANENFHWIRYVEFMGVKWKVTKADPLRPRIKLTLGGVYNG